MSTTSTVYDINLRYRLDASRAKAGVRDLRKETDGLAKSAQSSGKWMRSLGALAVGAFGFREGAKALIGFNSTVEDTKIQVAGMLALTKKTDLADQIGRADKLYANLQRRAMTLPGTTQDYANMLGMLTQPISDAGLGMKALEDLTINAVVGAKALGVAADVAARDIDQALRGQFHAVDPFSSKILGSIGYKGEEGRAKYNALSADKRASEYQRGLMQKQLGQLAERQGQTLSGVLSTLQDTVGQTFGKIGLPLFKAITAEVKRWNQWLEQNPERVNAIAHSLGDGLVKGFGFVKSVLSFMLDHADTLISIGKVWLAVKLAGMAGGALKGGATSLAGGMSDRMSAGKQMITGWGKGAGSDGREVMNWKGGRLAGSVASNIVPLAQSAAAGYAIGTAINDATGASHHLASGLDWLGDNIFGVGKRANKLDEMMAQTAREMKALNATISEAAATERSRKARGFKAFSASGFEATTAFTQQEASKRARHEALDKEKAGLTDASGKLVKTIGSDGRLATYNRHEADLARGDANLASGGTVMANLVAQAMGQMTEYQKKTLDSEGAQEAIAAQVLNALQTGKALPDVLALLKSFTEDPNGEYKGAPSTKPKVNVTIQRIEVVSDDPDRMAFGMIEAFRDAARNPSSAVAAMREA